MNAYTNGDLFENIKRKLNYNYVSDLRDMNTNVENNLDYVLLGLDPNKYEVQQWQDLSYYLFPHLKADLSSDASELRANLVLAIYEYRKMKNQIERLKAIH